MTQSALHAGLLMPVILGLTTASTRSQGLTIGELGASIAVGAPWKRQKLDPDLGKDQFQCSERAGLFGSNNVFLVVREMRTLLENTADFDEAFRTVATVCQDAKTVVKPGKDFVRASRRDEATVDGMKLLFRLELLTRAGLTYSLMAWSSRSQAANLDKKVDEIVDKFRFPSAESEWQKGIAPVTRKLAVDGYELSFQHRPFVLREKPGEEGQLIRYESADQNHLVIFAEVDGFGSPDRVLDAALREIRGDAKDLQEVSRVNLALGAVACRRLVAKDSKITYHVLAVPLSGQRFLEVHYLSMGSPEAQREDRDLLFKSLCIASVESPVALPESVRAAEPVALDESLAAILKRCKPILKVEGWHVSTRRLDAGGWLISDWTSAKLVAVGRPAETLIEQQGSRMGIPVPWQERWLVANEDEVVREVLERELQAAMPFRAHALAIAGGDLLLARRSSAKRPVGMSQLVAVGSDSLVRRNAAGEERQIVDVPELAVTDMTVDAEGKTVLVLGTIVEKVLSSHSMRREKLLEVDLATGAVLERGFWSDVRCLGRADGGWLVVGRPFERPEGIYLVREGRPTALITGTGAIGAELAGRKLVFATNSGRPPVTTIHEVVVEDVASEGPLCQPFATAHLNAIGTQLMAARASRAAPRTAAEIRTALAEANSAARRLAGKDLPRSGPAVDALFAEAAMTSRELAPAGRFVLALVLTGSYLDRGAIWVDSPAPGWHDWLCRKPGIADNPFAIARTPGGLLSDCFDDTEGAHDVGTTLEASACGRTILLGLDEQALRARSESSQPDGLRDALAKPDVNALQALLSEASANHWLRARVYEDLADRGQLQIVEALSKHFSTRPFAQEDDRRAWLSTWVQRVTDPKEAEAVVAAATAAVQMHPRAAALYYLLGVAYGKARPLEPELARTCYRRVVKLESWSEYGKAAQALLSR